MVTCMKKMPRIMGAEGLAGLWAGKAPSGTDLAGIIIGNDALNACRCPHAVIRAIASLLLFSGVRVHTQKGPSIGGSVQLEVYACSRELHCTFSFIAHRTTLDFFFSDSVCRCTALWSFRSAHCEGLSACKVIVCKAFVYDL